MNALQHQARDKIAKALDGRALTAKQLARIIGSDAKKVKGVLWYWRIASADTAPHVVMWAGNESVYGLAPSGDARPADAARAPRRPKMKPAKIVAVYAPPARRYASIWHYSAGIGLGGGLSNVYEVRA